MDIDVRRGRQLLRQLLGKPGLQQPAEAPGDDVDRWAIGTTATARHEVSDRHTWLVSPEQWGLTGFGQIR
jgi:hypothetical protein